VGHSYEALDRIGAAIGRISAIERSQRNSAITGDERRGFR
jgi:c-di-AMP phosphodiesterase-like protein